MKIKYKITPMFLFCLLFIAKAGAAGAETVIDLETEKSVIDIEKESITATDGVLLKYGDITIKSDNLKKIEKKNILFAYGNVLFKQGAQTIKADEVVFDMDTRKAKIISSESYDGNLRLRYGGEETLSEYPSRITIRNGWFTTSPYEKPNYKLNTRELIVYPDRKVVAKDISVVAGGRTWLRLPYYVASLKPASQRATLFPYIGSDNERGLFGIWGFDYDMGPLAQGFVDFEISAKKKLALKFSNDYAFGGNNSGNIFFNRLVIPIGNHIREWDFSWNHSVVNAPKVEKDQRKFYNLGYGIWNLNYKNTTTNLMRAIDGVLLKDDYSGYVNQYSKLRFYNFKIDQEIGRNGEFNLSYYWTPDKDALRELTKINDHIVDRDEIDPRRTDVDLFKRIKYINGNNDVAIRIDNEEFVDINPGYVGDLNSYRKQQSYSVDLRGPKIKGEYIDTDKDEYGEVRNLRERDDADYNSLESSPRWVQKVGYDKRREWGLTFGNYYPFRRSEYFGYEPRTISQYLINDFYLGASFKQVDIRRKEYEYDYSRDNPNFNSLFINSGTDDNSRIYKVYEDGDKIRRAARIVSEKYRMQKLNIGNGKIALPFRDSYFSFDMGFENRDYSDVLVPEFDAGRKIEDTSSPTGYRIARDTGGNWMKQNPSVNIVSADTRLFMTLYDNTARTDNKYDIRVTNDAGLLMQKTDAGNAMYNGNDIIEIPSNIWGLHNNFNFHIGNVTFNYNFTNRNDRHFSDGWMKNRYVRNFFKADIAGKRFISLDFESNEKYEFKDFMSEKVLNREIQYGYTSGNDDSFLYRYSDRNIEYFPYDVSMGWDKKSYKEATRDRTLSLNFNQWGIEYSNLRSRRNDIFGDSASYGIPDLKLKTETHRIGFVYDTKKMKNKKFESDHYFRVSYGFGKKAYRDLNRTPLIASDDRYSYGSDYTTVSLFYRYENNAAPKYARDLEKEDRKAEGNLTLNEEDIVRESNRQAFSIDRASRNVTENINIEGDNRLFLSEEEEQAYKSYVEEETYRQNKFNLNDFNSRLQELRKKKKYFQIGLDLEIDGSNSFTPTNIKGLDRLNDLTFKVEAGYLEKFFVAYRFFMEKPDRIYRNLPGRRTPYNFRKHELEAKYMFGEDPDKPWWIGGKIQYVKDGAPNATDPEIYESSSAATRVDKLTLGLVTLSHRFENVEWEIGAGMKWDKPDNKKLGYYPVITLKFGITPFPEKNAQLNYSGGRPSFGIGF